MKSYRMNASLRQLLIAPTLALLSLIYGGSLIADERPNIVLVLLDNTGWGDFGPYGGGSMRGAPSPNINQLASEGLTLTNFNTEPQCTPSRSALMTGRLAVRSGTHSVPIGVPYYGLIPWEETLAEKLGDSGYDTALFGKWHLGKTKGRFPTDQGFDYWYGIQDSSGDAVRHSNWTQQFSIAQDMKDSLPVSEYPWIKSAHKGEDPKPIKKFDLEAKKSLDGELINMASNYITEHSKADQPFFAYVALTAMHFPTLPSNQFSGKSGHGIYADLLVQTDHYVGALQKAITAAGIEGETIFIVTADNGPEAADNGNGQYTGWTGPWAGTYFTALEGGLRVPFFAKWPEHIPAGERSNDIVHIADLFPTLLDAAGVEISNDRIVDGLSMHDFFTGQAGSSPREGFPIFVGEELYAIKWRNWKAHFVWQDSKYAPKLEYSTVAKVVNLIQDPREERQSVEPYNAWTQYPGMGVLLNYHKSLRLQANIPTGAPDSFKPPPLISE